VVRGPLISCRVTAKYSSRRSSFHRFQRSGPITKWFPLTLSSRFSSTNCRSVAVRIMMLVPLIGQGSLALGSTHRRLARRCAIGAPLEKPKGAPQCAIGF
jgi:hypothetical protein